ncbi:MAG: hypothetical protein MJY83_03570 [Bacteroidales bacterium]|nr:hypothetical protein [Bacteroidales bacterium]
MKYIKYVIGLLAVAAATVSCEKHELIYQGQELVGDKAMFHICYFAPKTKAAANYIDSVYVNGKYYGGVGGSGQLMIENLLPTSGTRYYTAPAGQTKITLYQKDAVVYEKTVTLKSGKQDVYVPDLTMEPVVIDVTPFNNISAPEAGKFDTDSIASVRLINFLFEPDGNGGVAPTTRKIQYQWRNNSGEKDENGQYYWHNIGEPIAFGEASARAQVIVDKIHYANASGFNTSGYCRIWYRTVDAATGAEMTPDYWTAYIGRGYDHIYWGVYGTPRPSGYVAAEYQAFTML